MEKQTTIRSKRKTFFSKPFNFYTIRTVTVHISHVIRLQIPSREIIIVICHAVFCQTNIYFDHFLSKLLEFPRNEHKKRLGLDCIFLQLYAELAHYRHQLPGDQHKIEWLVRNGCLISTKGILLSKRTHEKNK